MKLANRPTNKQTQKTFIEHQTNPKSNEPELFSAAAASDGRGLNTKKKKKKSLNAELQISFFLILSEIEKKKLSCDGRMIRRRF